MRTIVALVIVLSLAGNVSADMVAHWTFDEDAGLTAYDSAGDNDGTIHGATWTDGKDGGALSFNGTNNYVDVPDDPSLRFTQNSSFSIAFWLNPSSSTGDDMEVVCKMQASGQGIFVFETKYYLNSSVCYAVSKSGISYTSITTGTNSVPQNSWHHIAAVYDNRDMKLYLDGVLKNTATFPYDTGTTTPTGDLCIGVRAYNGIRNQYFNGTIDDVRIYNNALSQAEVTALVPEPASAMIMVLGTTIISLRRRKC